METPETSKAFQKFLSWLKQNILIIVLLVLLSIFVVNKLNKFESIIVKSIIQPNVTLDFQNKSGAAWIRSSFTDILVGSDGSIKKGDGYEVKLTVLNPSSVTLNSIRCEFKLPFKKPNKKYLKHPQTKTKANNRNVHPSKCRTDKFTTIPIINSPEEINMNMAKKSPYSLEMVYCFFRIRYVLLSSSPTTLIVMLNTVKNSAACE